MNKPIFVCVPGILHTPAHFQPLLGTLRSSGYEGDCVSLPNIGDGADTAAPWDDAKAVRRVLEHLVVSQNREVVLVCHSYGGMPGCQAVKGLEMSARRRNDERGGISRLIFVNAFIVKEGETALDALIKTGQDPPPWIQQDPVRNNIQKPNSLVGEYLFNDMDSSTRAPWIDQLKPISGNHQTTPIQGSCWSIDVPKTYIFSSDDRALWPKTQRAMLNQVLDNTWSTREFASGHAPFLSQPEKFAECLIDEITSA